MKKIFTRIAVGLLLALAALLIFASTRPDTFRVERSLIIASTPEKIVPLISNFHHWTAWSPYEKLDPAMKRTFSGDSAGVGAVYEWASNSHAGAGRMEILEAAPSLIKIKLDFLKPFEGHNTAEFLLQPEGSGTKVTWAVYGPSPLLSKVMGIFFDMDHLIGKDFESGLLSLKSVSES
jgi:hypothetical protein